MRKFLTAAVGLALVANAASAQTTRAVSKFDVAGIPVIFKPISANEVIAVRLYIRGGSANLSTANAGIEKMMLQASTQGTAKYGKDAFAARSTESGTNIGSETTPDYSVLTLQGVRQNWSAAWDLFTQAALHPTFPASEVAIVKGRLVDAAKRLPDDADTYLNYLADSLLYSGHPYAITPAGTVSSLSSIDRNALAAWHKQRMTKENLLLVVVGNVPRADLVAKIRLAFGALPANGGAAVSVAALPAVTPAVVVVQRPLPTNYILGQFSAPTLTDPDYPAFRAATDILGDNLFQEVRTKRNLTYAVGSGLGTRHVNRGNLYVTAIAPDTTVKVIFSTVKHLQDEPLTQAAIAENENVSLTNSFLRQETNMGQATALGMWELVGGGWQNDDRFISAYKRVTATDIQRVARKYMQHARFVVIGDPAKVTQSLLTSF
ncbi:MAG: pitrilysin family protein [Gemmatimonadaceae bacterium]